MSNQLCPKIYVACLAAYNNGHLHGAWIDAHQTSDAILEEINALLETSPIEDAEEWAIHDYEDFGGARIDEYQGIDSVAEIAAFIAKHNALGAAVLSYTNQSFTEALRLLNECYEGKHDSEEDFARGLYESCYDIPNHLIMYIDYKAIARDLFITNYFTIDLKCQKHVFRLH
jgi:antirestriction protein